MSRGKKRALIYLFFVLVVMVSAFLHCTPGFILGLMGALCTLVAEVRSI